MGEDPVDLKKKRDEASQHQRSELKGVDVARAKAYEVETLHAVLQNLKGVETENLLFEGGVGRLPATT